MTERDTSCGEWYKADNLEHIFNDDEIKELLEFLNTPNKGATWGYTDMCMLKWVQEDVQATGSSKTLEYGIRINHGMLDCIPLLMKSQKVVYVELLPLNDHKDGPAFFTPPVNEYEFET